MEGFPGGSVIMKLPADAGDTGLIPDPGRSHRAYKLKVNQAYEPQLLNRCFRAQELELLRPDGTTANAHVP